jgi:hypothetical protein
MWRRPWRPGGPAMRSIVLDTNVLVSSLLVRAGLPARVLDGWRQRRYLVILADLTVHLMKIGPFAGAVGMRPGRQFP